eukprot:TRINITY_DN757_c0_g1_i1.p1 TRINITY_DN757_c0_g1~~TRINITY_DN757_c0_g1_i1.p1  ORF type:complete len:201 (+),score=29.90 TRINITY_DN757_c0_g1_i1:78-680(+)
MGCKSTKPTTGTGLNVSEEKEKETNEGPVNIKVLTIGDAGCGKTSLILKFVDDVFLESPSYTANIDFKVKEMEVKGKKVRFSVYDTAGQERFRTITSSYYRGADVILLCFNIALKDTFENLSKWLDEISRYAKEHITIILVGCKSDLTSEREVLDDEIKDFSESSGLQRVDTSAKTGSKIDYCFILAAQTHLEKCVHNLK